MQFKIINKLVAVGETFTLDAEAKFLGSKLAVFNGEEFYAITYATPVREEETTPEV